MTEAQDAKTTRVLFRVERAGVVLAIFPDIDEGRGNLACYAGVGQHGVCHRHYVRDTRPASPEQYECLKAELEGAPYGYRLAVLKTARGLT